MEAQKVNDYTITSSPGSTPQAISAKCKAEVPETSAAIFLLRLQKPLVHVRKHRNRGQEALPNHGQVQP